MREALTTKVRDTIKGLREAWARVEGRRRFVAFSTGKDSLALAAMLYEAVEPERPTCLYAHHDLEFPGNLEYVQELKERGFAAQVVRPFLEYFELMERGIGFLTLKDPWCVPMLVGTGILEWLQQQGARSPRDAVMFRGMSGTEYSHKWHSRLELYGRLDLPTFNPLLGFSKEEILEVLGVRYGLPLNPIYEHMDRTYCIVCYTSDARRQAYSERHYPEICARYVRVLSGEPRFFGPKPGRPWLTGAVAEHPRRRLQSTNWRTGFGRENVAPRRGLEDRKERRKPRMPNHMEKALPERTRQGPPVNQNHPPKNVAPRRGLEPCTERPGGVPQPSHPVRHQEPAPRRSHIPARLQRQTPSPRHRQLRAEQRSHRRDRPRTGGRASR